MKAVAKNRKRAFFQSLRVIFCVASLGMFLQPGFAQLDVRLARMGWRTDFSQKTIDLNELSVNVRRDGIPAIDNPVFVSIADAKSWVKNREPVVAISIDGIARAYPLQILIWHEIVNDELNGSPIVVTFCPLCYSALAFERTIDDRLHDFGVSGMLRHSDLVMYDRQTHSLFQQLNGRGLVGSYSGKVLRPVAAQIISFEQFYAAYPEGDVLSQSTGHSRSYGRNPYPGYDDIRERPWAFTGPEDGRLPPMEKVVTVEIAGHAKAYSHSYSKKEKVINDEVGNTNLVVFHTSKGATSALDRASISGSKVLGSTGVFERDLDGKTLVFEKAGNQFQDTETGSIWDVTGQAVSGPLVGSQLIAIPHSDMFSFAWFVIHPDTELLK